MFLVAWWLAGVFLGWFIWKFYRAWQSERRRLALDGYSATRLDAITREVLGLLNAILARHGHRLGLPLHDDRPNDLIRPSVDALGRRLAGWVAIALLVIALAAGTDNAQLYQWMLVVKSYLVGVRAQALIVGLLSGIVFRRYRRPLGGFVKRLGNAVIGSKDNTAWALQGALAVGLIAIGLFAVRPDLLQYLRSFKFGTVEATFSDQGPLPLRDARLNLREFRERVAVRQYSKFREDFIAKESARGFARDNLTGPDNAALQKETGEIAARIFESYVNPVLESILCLDKVHALRSVIQDPNLGTYAVAWEDFLRKLHDNKGGLTRIELKSFLSQLRIRSEPFVNRAMQLNPSCPDLRSWPLWIADLPELSTKDDARQAEIIFGRYGRAVDLLKKRRYDSPAVISLVVFEPYLTGAVSDLIALISGEREKTDFLLNMLDGFPLSDDLITPGIVNLYYQVTYSWLNSTGSLPLDLVRERIEYATRGADILMARAAAWSIKTEKVNSADTKVDDAGVKASNDAAKVYDIFLRNLFALLPAEVDVYVQHVLAGEAVPEQHRQSWIRAASRLHAMLRLRQGIPIPDIDGLNPIELDDKMKGRLRAVDPDSKIDPDFLLQADLAMALSAILLQDGSRASARNCGAALMYINEASTQVRPTVDDIPLDRAQELRLLQLIGAVANRIAESCDWTDARGKSAGSQPPKAAEAGAK